MPSISRAKSSCLRCRMNFCCGCLKIAVNDVEATECVQLPPPSDSHPRPSNTAVSAVGAAREESPLTFQVPANIDVRRWGNYLDRKYRYFLDCLNLTDDILTVLRINHVLEDSTFNAILAVNDKHSRALKFLVAIRDRTSKIKEMHDIFSDPAHPRETPLRLIKKFIREETDRRNNMMDSVQSVILDTIGIGVCCSCCCDKCAICFVIFLVVYAVAIVVLIVLLIDYIEWRLELTEEPQQGFGIGFQD